MTDIRVGNAPCSWGALEFEGMQVERIGFAQMLDELKATGYIGTDLGDWGFMPTEPAQLHAELSRRELAMIGAFVPVAFKDPAAHDAGEQHALRVARLLATVSDTGAERHQPVVILADDSGTDPVRTQHAGRITADMGLSAAEWRTFVAGAERVARAVREQTGLRVLFHHHCAGYVETPAEIATLIELSDPELIGLVFDTGHFAFGSGTNDPDAVLAALERHRERIELIHFKDCEPGIADAARTQGWDYFEAVRRGVFCELGQGLVDFAAVMRWLRDTHYAGWLVVEQDVLPGMGSPRESAQRNRDFLRTLGV